MSRYFELENKLTTDTCALLSKELQNKSINDYRLYNMYPTSTCDNSEEMAVFVANNPNLRYRDGYGNVNACTVDDDSELRNNARMTNLREKEQLCTRWNHAGPDYGRGGLIPNVESKLKLSEDTSYIKDCDIVSEKAFNRFIPMVGCLRENIQNPANIVLPFERGGKMTRDYVLNDEYLQKCGFEKKNNNWVKKQN